MKQLEAIFDSVIARDAKSLAAALYIINEMACALRGKPLDRDESFRVAESWRLSKAPSAVPGTVCIVVDDAGPVPVQVWHSERPIMAPPAPRRDGLR